MSIPECDAEEQQRWADAHARRAEFRRRLAERGITVGLPRTDKPWVPPVPLPVSADEASEVVVRMRRGEL